MNKRGRQPGFKMTEEHRDKIRKSNILSALIGHAEGTREMTASQVTAGLGLLKKCLPDLSSVELSGGVEQTIISAKPISAEEWAAKHAADNNEDES